MCCNVLLSRLFVSRRSNTLVPSMNMKRGMGHLGGSTRENLQETQPPLLRGQRKRVIPRNRPTDTPLRLQGRKRTRHRAQGSAARCLRRIAAGTGRTSENTRPYHQRSGRFAGSGRNTEGNQPLRRSTMKTRSSLRWLEQGTRPRLPCTPPCV